MKKYAILLGSLLLTSMLSAQGSLESEGPTYNDLEILKVKVLLKIVDADLNKAINASLQVKDLMSDNSIWNDETPLNGANLTLRSDKLYNIYIQAKNYNDTVITIDFSKNPEFTGEQIIRLLPKKVDFEINISDIETGEGLPLGVVLSNRNRDEIIEVDPSQGNKGCYKVRIREEDEYELEVKNPKEYIFYSNTISSKNSQQKLAIQLQTLIVGAKIPLYNITFETGKWDLNENSQRELDRIIKLLNDNPTAIIEIGAHTDDKGSVNFNMELSQKRSGAVLDYMKSRKMPINRFVTKAYGKSKPIASNATEEGRAKNRRFELIILKV